MALGGRSEEGNGYGCLIGDEVRESAVRHGDHRQPGEHRLGHRQAKAFSPGRVYIAVGQAVESFELSVVEVTIDPPDVGRIRMVGSQLGQYLFDAVVGIRERLQDEGDRARSVERVEIGAEQDVDALSGKGGADVEEDEPAEVVELRSLYGGLWIGS